MELKEMCYETRKAMLLTQREFAKLIGATQTEVSFIEGGFVPPNKQKVKLIKELYKKAKEAKS